MKKKSFLYGAMLLTISAIISKVLGAIYRIPLTNLIGSEGIGIYQMIFPVYALLLVISSSGIPVCVSRLVSGEIANKKHEHLGFILKKAVILTIIISSISSLIVFFGANYLATLQGNTMATIGYFAISPAILLGSLVAVFRGYFEGLQDMRPTAISEVIEQIAKVALGLLLAGLMFSRGLEYGVMGAVLGISLGEVVSLFVVLIMYRHNLKKQKTATMQQEGFEKEVIVLQNGLENKTVISLEKKGFMKSLFKESLPITFGAIIIPLTLFIDSVLMINLLTGVGFSTTTSTRLFGLQAGVVASLVQLPIIISISLATALLPNIVAANTVKNNEEISKKSTFAIKLVWFFSFASFLGYILLAGDITHFLYAEGLENSLIDEVQIVINLIYISAISIIYHSFLRIFISLLHAINKSPLVAKNLFIASVVKIVLTIVLVTMPTINIYGASLASTIGYAVGCIVCLWSIRKFIVLNFTKKEFVVAPMLSGVLLVGLVLLTKFLLSLFLPQSITTLVAILIGGLGYLIGIIILKGFHEKELESFSFFSKILKKRKKQIE